MLLSEALFIEDTTLDENRDVFLKTFLMETQYIQEDNKEEKQPEPPKPPEAAPAKSEEQPKEAKGEAKKDVMFIAKMLKPMAKFIVKYNPAKYIMIFVKEGIRGLAKLLPESLGEKLIKVYEKLDNLIRRLFEPNSGLSAEDEAAGKGVNLGGYRVTKAKIVGFVIAGFSYAVIIGAIWKLIDKKRQAAQSGVKESCSISLDEYLAEEGINNIAEVPKPKSAVSAASYMIRRYGETTSTMDRIKDETKKTFLKVAATIIAAAVMILIFYLFNCLFFKLFVRIDALIKRKPYDEYKEIVIAMLNEKASDFKSVGVFTHMYITVCNIFGEVLKISMFRKEDLGKTLIACLGGEAKEKGKGGQGQGQNTENQ